MMFEGGAPSLPDGSRIAGTLPDGVTLEEEIMEKTSIYRSGAAEAQIRALYRGLLDRWPVPFAESDIQTRYGSVHVVSSGRPDGPVVLLLHASSMASTSWLPNVEALTAAGHRVHAIDYIGEAGESRLADSWSFPKTGTEIGSLYAEIARELGVQKAAVVGASAGGHTALRFALQAPDVVTRLALLGPMGINPLGLRTLAKMMLVSLRPTDALVARVCDWSIGTAPAVAETFGEWFRAVLRSIATPPRVGRPAALKPAEMAQITAPILLVLGTRDNLVGDHRRAARRAAPFRNLTVEVLDSAHLIGVERAEDVNDMLVRFLDANAPN
jgi:pimeloyl-ACP methyl ester carboxylesterase